ncbi:MAG: hypothetical protein Q8Q25_03410 [bacterium]|nr:hypothetical protein [bacterium]
MNSSLRKSFTGAALSCMLLCSTASAHESTGKIAVKAIGHAVLAANGLAYTVVASGVWWYIYRHRDTILPEQILSAISASDFILPELFMTIPGIYTTYKNIRALVKLYKKTHKNADPVTK